MSFPRIVRPWQPAILLAACLAFSALGGDAQNLRPGRNVSLTAMPVPAPIERGWIGIGVDLDLAEAQVAPGNLVVRVVRTVDGGPASAAGVVPGDIIRAINDEPVTMASWQDFTRNLRRGVDLTLRLDGAGRGRLVRLTTTSRPSLVPAPSGLTAHLDSVRRSFETQLRSKSAVWASRDYVTLLMEGEPIEDASARILDQARQNSVNYGLRPAARADFVAPSTPNGDRYTMLSNTDVALPFEYLMLRSPEADSVKTAIIHLRGELNEVAEATRVRERELRAIVELRARDLGDGDAQLIRLRSDNERVHDDLEQLAFRLAEIGSNERDSRMEARGIGASLTVHLRPVTAGVAGRNFVGGAQFNDLNPELGVYFGTERGVLVIQVLRGTPCDNAGLVPGDVVTHVGETAVDSVERFRSALNGVFAGERSAELTLMRKGERVSATLSR